MKKIKKIMTAVIVLLIIVAAGMYILLQTNLKAVDENNKKTIEVEIAGGTSTVIQQLDEAGLLKNSFFSKLYLKLNDYEFKANTYVLDTSMDAKEIFKILEDAPINHIVTNSFTVIDGTTIVDYATAVGEVLGLSSQEVLNQWSDKSFLQDLIDEYWFLTDEILQEGIYYPLEGYLAANTYLVTNADMNLEKLTKVMLDQKAKELEQYRDQMKNMVVDGKKLSIHEFLSLASVVQAESLFEHDHAKIAGVFVHRMEYSGREGTGGKLQSDVTVNYANQEVKVAVTYADLEVDSLYNTYLYPGIPVGPICAMNQAIIEATLNYEKTDNLFFFAIKGGDVIYTKTYQKHMNEIAKAKEAGLWLED